MTEQSAVADRRIGRDDLCWCGSGKKYKRCCLRRDSPVGITRNTGNIVNTVNTVNTGNTDAGGRRLKLSAVSERIDLAVTLHKAGRLQEAGDIYAEILRVEPDHAEAIHNSGMVAYQTGNYDLAQKLITRAIELEPRKGGYVLNLGKVLQFLGELEQATVLYRKAVLLAPGMEHAHYQLGNALIKQNNFVEAAVSLTRAISLKPDYHEAIFSLGMALQLGGRRKQAAVCYRTTIAMVPDYALAHNNLGTVMVELEEFDQAVECYRAALAAQPEFTAPHGNLLYLHALLRDISPQEERRLAHKWEKTVLTDRFRALVRTSAFAGSGVFPVRPLEGRKLRLGICSGDLGDHPVSEFLEPILTQLDRSRIHLTLFTTLLKTGARADRLRKLADSYISLIDVEDGPAAEQIRAEQIDVLMDTSGHTSGARLGVFARRAAPVQCSYVGYWSTTGVTEMDWYITDLHCPASIDAHFTEGLWRLPRLAYCYYADSSLAEGGWTPDPGGTVWLGSFNKFGKIREQTLALWAAVLHGVPEARILFEDRQVDEDKNHQRIWKTLAAHGIAADRIAFIPFVDGHERHMMMYHLLDIALDTVPFNSGTTAYDALWMGVPLVTLKGDWLGGILTGSVLKAFGREEWIAENTEDYVSIVRSLARDVEGRKVIRETQRARMAVSPLCDSKGLTRSLEEAFESMYNRWMGVVPPAANCANAEDSRDDRDDRLVAMPEGSLP